MRQVLDLQARLQSQPIGTQFALKQVMRPHADTSFEPDRFAIEADAFGFDYVNHFEVGFGHYEVLLRFAQAFDGVDEQMRRTCIVMTPPYAKALLLMLSGAISRFEAVHGELPVAGAASNDATAAP